MPFLIIFLINAALVAALTHPRLPERFRDLEVEASGIPITSHRTYDTRRKGESLDFGFGWSIDYQDVAIQSNGVTGLGWQLVTAPFKRAKCEITRLKCSF